MARSRGAQARRAGLVPRAHLAPALLHEPQRVAAGTHYLGIRVLKPAPEDAHAPARERRRAGRRQARRHAHGRGLQRLLARACRGSAGGDAGRPWLPQGRTAAIVQPYNTARTCLLKQRSCSFAHRRARYTAS
jgi:hypothetical protein